MATTRHLASKAEAPHAESAVGVDLFNPSEEHAQLRSMIRNFVEKEVDPQALEHNRKEEVRPHT